MIITAAIIGRYLREMAPVRLPAIKTKNTKLIASL